MRQLEEATVDPRMAAHVARGQRLHRDWVRTSFAPQLAAAIDATELEDLLVVATDVYTWKLLRRDARRSRAQVIGRMQILIRRLLGEGG
jgi:hypothetical protein